VSRTHGGLSVMYARDGAGASVATKPNANTHKSPGRRNPIDFTVAPVTCRVRLRQK